MSNVLAAITLHQPWATWIMRGWKTIETRTHSRFACLSGKTILIHSSQKIDTAALSNPFLTEGEILYKQEEYITGHILGTALVTKFRKLDPSHTKPALIECHTQRYGLFLENITVFDNPIPCKGELGIWYFDLDTNQKVKKPQ